jgi:hypothetical protein
MLLVSSSRLFASSARLLVLLSRLIISFFRHLSSRSVGWGSAFFNHQTNLSEYLFDTKKVFVKSRSIKTAAPQQKKKKKRGKSGRRRRSLFFSMQRSCSHHIDKKQYEFTNHLGNVQATVSDLPYPFGEYQIERYHPALPATYDYYPFGMLMPDRFTSDTTNKCMTVTQTRWVTQWVEQLL